jgi:hypothetical protein
MIFSKNTKWYISPHVGCDSELFAGTTHSLAGGGGLAINSCRDRPVGSSGVPAASVSLKDRNRWPPASLSTWPTLYHDRPRVQGEILVQLVRMAFDLFHYHPYGLADGDFLGWAHLP